MPPPPRGDYSHLAAVVRAERGPRTRADLQRVSDIGLTTLGKLESGEPTSYGPIVRAKLERAFHWQDGSFQRVLEGKQPVRRPDPQLARLLAVWAQLSSDGRQMLVDLAENAVRAH